MLIRTDIFDWKQVFCLSVDLRHMELVKNVALNQGLTNIRNYICHQMILRDPCKLPTERLPLQVSSLNESHVALVNSTWKFGMGEFSEHFVRDIYCEFTITLCAGCRGSAGVMDFDLCFWCNGNAVHTAGAQTERLRQSPGDHNGKETVYRGLSSVLLNCGG